MSITIRIALAGVFFLGLASAVSAQPGFDGNLANRYPSYADPGKYGYTASGNAPGFLHSEQQAAMRSRAGARARPR